jgi:hypothetical protein
MAVIALTAQPVVLVRNSMTKNGQEPFLDAISGGSTI